MINLKDLIKEVENLNKTMEKTNQGFSEVELMRIKQTVEAVEYFNDFDGAICIPTGHHDWQKLKELLGVK